MGQRREGEVHRQGRHGQDGRPVRVPCEPHAQRPHLELRKVAIAFLDLFSQQASAYASARPSYPDALFEYIATLTPRRSLVWDCACGNGQASAGLGRHFDRVIATDASAEQVARAVPADHVEYRVARAEDSGLEDKSVGLVTVAQALHWFPTDAFFGEVRRVSAAGGMIAAWSYASCHAGDDVEALLREFEDDTMGPYWNPARRYVDEEYRTIPFPFDEIAAPGFELHKVWTLDQFGGYLRSWSAVATYVLKHKKDPLVPFLKRLGKLWGPAGSTRDVRWPLFMRVGRVG